MAHAAVAQAGRYDHLPADDGQQLLTLAEAQRIAVRTDELMRERFSRAADFADMMTGLEHADLYEHLHAALLHIDNACSGDEIATRYVLRAVAEIQRMAKAGAEAWRDECAALAEREL